MQWVEDKESQDHTMYKMTPTSPSISFHAVFGVNLRVKASVTTPLSIAAEFLAIASTASWATCLWYGS
jgi:hypothetical protein